MLTHGIRRVPCALALVVLGTLLAAGSGSAKPVGACMHGAALHSTALSAASPSSAAYKSAVHSYDDYIEDVVSAPDICSSNIVTNDNLTVTMAVHAHDRSSFSSADGYRIYVDADSNPATGSGVVPGDPAGAEYLIDVLDESSSLRQWSGTSFDPVPTQSPIMTFWLDGYGPVLQLARKDLGDVRAFTFVIVTSNGADRDLAPDSGSWTYTVSELALAPGRLAVGQAKAGKPLVASMPVTRSDFDLALEEGKITCSAQIGGKRLAGKGRFADERVGCAWRIPQTARGKRVSGSVAVTFQGVTAKRSFNVRVR
jgi:hypothetical protein